MGRMAGTVYIYLVFYADVISQGFVTGLYKAPRTSSWEVSSTLATELLSFTGYY